MVLIWRHWQSCSLYIISAASSVSCKRLFSSTCYTALLGLNQIMSKLSSACNTAWTKCNHYQN